MNGKLGTEEFTQTAVDTFFAVGGIRGVIPFAVELGRFLQDLFGAKLDTKTASFTSILEDFDLASAGLYLVLGQSFSPIFHATLSLSRYISVRRNSLD